MKAMILAAGRGTRLQPLTDNTPKALVKAGGMTLLQRLIHKLKVQGVNEIIINVHHYADQIRNFLEEQSSFNIPITISDESEHLLETGGGIKKAAELLAGEEAFIVHNVDVLTDIDLRKIYDDHVKNNSLATLAVRKRETSRYLLFDEEMRLHGWENRNSGEQIIPSGERTGLQSFAFSGIHVISPHIFPLISEEGAFSIIDTYLRLSPDHLIKAYLHDEGLWIDAGKPDGLKLANMLMGGDEL